MGSPIHQKLLERLYKLNPNLKPKGTSLKEIYLELKREGWRYSPAGMLPWKQRPQMSESLKKNLIAQFSKQYQVENHPEDQLYVFYANAVQGLYAAVAAEIKGGFAKSKNFTGPIQRFGVELIDAHFFPNNLESRRLSPEQAEEMLNRNLSDDNFWQVAKEIYERKQALFQEPDLRDLTNWLEELPKFQTLDESQQKILLNTMAGYRKNQICCQTDPGCVQCPHNRRSLKKPENE